MSDNIFTEEFLICESPVSKVYGCDFDNVFSVRSMLFDKDFITRAYTSKMTINSVGEVNFNIVWKDGRKRLIGQPFHLLRNGVLFTLKLNKHRNLDSFALNHELFSLDWTSCVILHFFDNKPYIFIASREECMALSVLGQQGEELQVFMRVPDYRRLPASMVPTEGKSWLSECVEYKRNR